MIEGPLAMHSPFSNSDSHTEFDRHLQKACGAIDRMENARVLNSSAAELERQFVDEASIIPLVVRKGSHYIEEQRAVDIDASHHFRRTAFHDVQPHVRGTLLVIAIPFEGDKSLWIIRPSTFGTRSFPDIQIRDDRVLFHLSFPDESVDPQQLNQEIEGLFRILESNLEHLRRDVDPHNARVPAIIAERIAAKRQRALAAVNAIASLGIPMKRRDVPATYTIPLQCRPRPVTGPVVAGKAFEPEPELAMAEYEHILSVLTSMSLLIERNPQSFASMDEEAIRDHFLLQLNGHYEGCATGETFNKAGKTDILIRQNDRNVFISENKFWRRPRSFEDAIEQLLGYLTWRDCKTALLIFNRNRDSAGVATKMHEILTNRAEFRKTVSSAPTGAGRYVLVKASEPGREIIIATLLFDVPVLGGE